MKEIDETKLMIVSVLTLFIILYGAIFILFLKDYTVMNLLSLVGAVYVSILIAEKFENNIKRGKNEDKTIYNNG